MSFAVASECSRICSAAAIRASASLACCSASSASCCAWRCASSAAARAASAASFRQPPGLRQLLRRVLDELLGSLLGRLGLALGLLDLLVDLRLDLLLLLFGIRLGGLALALHGLVRGLLRLGDALLDAPGRLALHLRQARAPALAHLASVVGALLGLLRGLDGALLGLPSTLRGLPRALHPDVDRVAADRSGVDHGRSHLPPSVASARRRGLGCAPTASAGLSARDSSHAALDGISRRPVRARSDNDIITSLSSALGQR